MSHNCCFTLVLLRMLYSPLKFLSGVPLWTCTDIGSWSFFGYLCKTMDNTSIVTWNVRGLNSPLKRAMVNSVLRKYHPAIIGMQETHLKRDTLCCLQYSWEGHIYHSTHTSYSRGVSVRVHKYLGFLEFQSAVDTEGRYIFLYCRLYMITCIIAVVYMPPSFSTVVLKELMSFMLARCLSLRDGDFNAILNPRLDKHPPASLDPTVITSCTSWPS